ncbi:acyl-CoA reductase [Celerinatantimonas yamalensis]|uniref:Acyl-CoA reductase n=1 Tax=Celerinatantimonas yamalensis TaxID=559956 RepID=A0ABW9GAK7_9GAMM
MQRYIQLTTEQYQQIEVVAPFDEGLLSFNQQPLPCYASLILEFMAALSDALCHISDAPNAKALGFFLRQRALEKAVNERLIGGARAPMGVSFHLVPGNVPMVAFHSAFASLLQGNPTIVRLSSRQLDEQQVVFEILNTLLAEPRWQTISERLRFIRYARDDVLTQALSGICQSRVIWGGDASIEGIRGLPLPASAFELTFADRQSLALFDEVALRELPGRAIELQLKQLAQDISQFGQQSCSSPGLLVWLGQDVVFRERLFAQLASFLDDSLAKASEQLTILQLAVTTGQVSDYQQHHGVGWGQLAIGQALPARGAGVLYWQQRSTWHDWLSTADNFQTCVMVGGSRDALRERLADYPALRLDRIVAPGQALAFDWYWDGIDLLSQLSRRQG